MDAEEYIAQYGATLSDSEKRYIRAFGPPPGFAGPSRRPETPAQVVGAAPSLGLSEAEREREEQLRATEESFARMQRLDEEAEGMIGH